MYICVCICCLCAGYSMCSSVCAHAHVSLKHFTLALPNSAASVDRALMDRISLALAVALAVDSPPRLPRPFGGPSESSHCIRFGAKSKVVQVRNTLTRVPHYLLQLVLELETIRIHIRTRTRLHSHIHCICRLTFPLSVQPSQRDIILRFLNSRVGQQRLPTRLAACF